MNTGKILLAIIIAIASSVQVLAALQVTAFSCNGESGTVNIPNNEAFTCTATINNPDDSTASLSNAKLYIDGTWATQSYDGTGFSTSLATGASTTAAFFDITPTTPGSHKFAYILLDGVSDTFAADTTVNVMDLRISEASPNITTAKQGEKFDIVVKIPTGGAMSVTATIELSDCTLATGEQINKTLGSMTEGAQTSLSWKAVMGSGACSYTVTVTGTGSGRVTDDLSGSVSNSGGGGSGGNSGSSGSSGGGGGGGGGGGAALGSESVIVDSIAAGSIGTFSFAKFADIAISQISFRSKVNLENAKLTVAETKIAESVAKPGEANWAVYKYILVSKEKVSNDKISDVTITFKVAEDWVKNSIKPETIVLKKLIGDSWELQPTTYTGKQGKYYTYTATMQALSIFAIVGEKTEGAAAAEPEKAETPEEETAPEETPSQPEQLSGQERPGQERTIPILDYIPFLNPRQSRGLSVLAIIGIAASLYFWHHHHRKIRKIEERLDKKYP